MDALPSSDQDCKPAYTTSKQVQAWFLRRSRDSWKSKYAELKVQLKRFRQRVADIDRSRAQWRRHAEDARRQVEALQAENARLRAAWDAADAGGGKDLPACPRR
jgi:septal ring factor EnvC (AmiA/AmiB activator)